MLKSVMRPSSRSVEPIQRANQLGSSQELANETAAPCYECALEWGKRYVKLFWQRTLPNMPDLLTGNDHGSGSRPWSIRAFRPQRARWNARGVVGGPGIEPGT